MKSVSVWDRSRIDRPTIAEGHPRLSEDDSRRLVSYLKSGTMVLRSTAMQPDWFAPNDGPRVRMSTYTDGLWFWNDSLIYYVENYSLSPGDEFMDYLKSREYVSRIPSDAEVREVLSILGVADRLK